MIYRIIKGWRLSRPLPGGPADPLVWPGPLRAWPWKLFPGQVWSGLATQLDQVWSGLTRSDQLLVTWSPGFRSDLTSLIRADQT